MAALGRGESVSCSNPKLDIFMRLGGNLVDIAALEFQIFDKVIPASPVQVYPNLGRYPVDFTNDCPTGDRLGLGHYFAKYTVPANAPTGTYEIRWFFRLTPSSSEQEFREEFEVLPSAVPSVGGYTTLQEMREEGVPSTGPNAVSDERLQRSIFLASRQIDRFTLRWFEPRRMVFTLDGSDAPTMFLEQPIISVDDVSLDGYGSLGLDSIVVYNRHLTENLLNPDDRENPRIQLVQPFTPESVVTRLGDTWPPGQRNVIVSGVFGYTEFDGTATGSTPMEINEAARMLTMRVMPLKYAQSTVITDADRDSRVIELRTRDQSIKWAAPGGSSSASTRTPGQGMFTGDPRIDSILLKFAAPPLLRAI
jgi:hypothetical protein